MLESIQPELNAILGEINESNKALQVEGVSKNRGNKLIS
jgi:hypothetical protein